MTPTTATSHAPRLDLGEELPAAYAAIVRLDQAASGQIDAALKALVELRVSQINGCAFCLDMHARALRELGESQQRLDMLAAWREVSLFDERERAALEFAESVTRLEPGGVPDDVWDAAAAAFPGQQMAGLLAAVIVINAWNRVAVPSRMAVPEIA
ncbi:carboxymuconolactone decarboxylase family protein [Capillimicrobium parvum]|nr:carboxymuconolactone decarboxylase family protein [Capillimicrobium parvum]